MPAEIDTMKLIEHIDRKFEDADRKRADGLSVVHRKLDDNSQQARDSLDAFRTETTAALGGIGVQLGKHELRLDSIESKAANEDSRADGWWKTGAAVVLGGGGLHALLEWLRGKG